VQPHAVVALPHHGEFGAQHGRITDGEQVRPFGLDMAEQRLDPGLVGWRAGTAEMLVDRAQGHELPGRARGHLRTVVAERQQHRPGRVVHAGVDQAVLAGADPIQQPLARQRVGEHHLDLGGGLLDRDDLGQPLAAHQVSTTVAATPALVKWV